jgi:hypothetical protein
MWTVGQFDQTCQQFDRAGQHVNVMASIMYLDAAYAQPPVTAFPRH